MQHDISLQDQFFKNGICFGCGPTNEKGLQIKSYVKGDELVATFEPKVHHQAFNGVINGGIIGALLDCHSNWMAAYALMKAKNMDHPPCTVTSEFNVKLKRPTPLTTISLTARLVALDGDKATIYAELFANGKCCATCDGIFVAVKEGHPAFHRW